MIEADARFRIDRMLEEAGYEIGSTIRLEGDVKDSELKNNLKNAGRRPDYHLYDKDSDIPLAFIEAKGLRGASLDAALKQVLECAQLAFGKEAPEVILFASNGVQVKSMHGNGKPVLVNGFPLEDIPGPGTLKQLVEKRTSTLGAEIETHQDLMRIFSKASDFLRRDGVDAGMEQLREFCFFLFVKIMSERQDQEAKQFWYDMVSSRGDILKEKFEKILGGYKSKYGDIFVGSKIRDSKTLESLVFELEQHNFSATSFDVKGQAFEHFLTAYSAGKTSVLGQYFTPRFITKFMARLMEIKPGNTVFDPFCGTGGMLISAYGEIYNQLDSKSNHYESRLAELKQKTLYGTDISGGASSLAKMNMIILGDGHSNIENADTFLRKNDNKRFSHVITNIPFNLTMEQNNHKLEPYIKISGMSRPDMNALCIVKCVESLKEGGNAAIVVPWTVCVSSKYKKLREYIKKKTSIMACFRLPEKTFVTYTSAQTAILLLADAHMGGTMIDFNFVHLKNDGMTQNTQREPIPENDFPDVLEYYLDGKLGSHPACFSVPCDSDKFVQEDNIGSDDSNLWRLGDILDIKEKENIDELLDPKEYYAQPSLDSQNNTVSVNGEKRLVKNFKGKKKKIAKQGDLIIGTLHTNRRNGLFAVADQEYICDSQLVASINNKIPVSYLVECLRRKFPIQLIPADLVGRENFTEDEILNVTIPKPDCETMKKIRQIDLQYWELTQKTKSKLLELRDIIDSIEDANSI